MTPLRRSRGPGQRMFVAITPPADVIDSLTHFLQPRWEAESGLRWTQPEQWHLTLAFLPTVTERSLDRLIVQLGRAGRRRSPMELQLASAGVFPDVYEARVLFVEPVLAEEVTVELHRLMTGVRHAAAHSGAAPQGGRFHPHLTVARSGGPFEATRWLRILKSWRSAEWVCRDFTLFSSQLGAGLHGSPLYTPVETFSLG